MRILVVEDSLPGLRLLQDILTLRGHEVVGAISVPDATSKLSEPFDLALVDLRVIGGGGERLLAKLRSIPHLAHVPAVAVTALAMAGDRERVLGLGFDGYISKPIGTRRFAEQVEAFNKPPKPGDE